ncbi:MAG: amidoligase family protein [Bacteroidaceae bacterium]
MNTFAEQINDVVKSNLSVADKAQALIKLGLTKYEATHIATSWLPQTPEQPFFYTFGVEMETVNCDRSIFYDAAQAAGLEVYTSYGYNHNDMPKFKLVPDSSLSGTDCAECVTPALGSDGQGFNQLQKCCEALNAIGATVNRSCGLHVHIGAADLTDREYCNVFVNYMMLETAIESFLAPSRRGANARWCASLRNHESDVLNATSKVGMKEALRNNRYHRVNPCAYSRHRTIEFRQHQGSISYTKIKAWIDFLGKLVEYSKKHRLTKRIDRIEDIPFLTDGEKAYFIGRRNALGC